MCRQDSTKQDFIAQQSSCLTIVDQKLLIVSAEKESEMRLPGGNNHEQLNAQCNAHDHVWQQTGFNVLVKHALGNLNPQHPIFLCELKSGFIGKIQHFVPPSWVDADIQHIQLVNPFVIKPSQWHDYDELIKVRQLFNQAQTQNAESLHQPEASKNNSFE